MKSANEKKNIHVARLPVIGVTGPSGAGKSLFCSFLSDLGWRVLDCDLIYRKMTDRPSACTRELALEGNFGSGILLTDGSLDRGAMAKIVFSEDGSEKLSLLNKITHKYVISSIKRRISHPGNNRTGFVIDAPLLFQADIGKDCDLTVAVTAPRELRSSRIIARDSIAPDAAEARLSAAMPEEWFSERADLTVFNDGDSSLLEARAREIDAMLRGG
ncbi:MAG: dephospho-CoA kinase [Clostridia bacterium]|nr:dephospho-CoA kinase [Clostridia bacterium]